VEQSEQLVSVARSVSLAESAERPLAPVVRLEALVVQAERQELETVEPAITSVVQVEQVRLVTVARATSPVAPRLQRTERAVRRTSLAVWGQEAAPVEQWLLHLEQPGRLALPG
jgi:hypothetical protein